MYVIDCSTVPVVTNADPAVFTGTTYQHTATYTCSIGYHMSDPTKETITCGATSWDPIEFTCDPNGNVYENYMYICHGFDVRYQVYSTANILTLGFCVHFAFPKDNNRIKYLSV